jgi:hypothetical protein
MQLAPAELLLPQTGSAVDRVPLDNYLDYLVSLPNDCILVERVDMRRSCAGV